MKDLKDNFSSSASLKENEDNISLLFNRIRQENDQFFINDNHNASDNDIDSPVHETNFLPEFSCLSIVCQKSLSAGVSQGAEKLQQKLADFLRSFISDSDLLRTIIAISVKQRLHYLYSEYQRTHVKQINDKHLFYFIGQENTEVARAYVVDFFINRLSPVILVKTIMATDSDHHMEMSGMLFRHLANAFVYVLQREMDQNLEEAVYVKAIFKCWSSKHADAFDSLDVDICLHQRALVLLHDYFTGWQLDLSDQVYVELFNSRERLNTLWSPDEVLGLIFQAYFKIDQAKIESYKTWRLQATPTKMQSVWNYVVSFWSGEEIARPTSKSLPTTVTNPLNL